MSRPRAAFASILAVLVVAVAVEPVLAASGGPAQRAKSSRKKCKRGQIRIRGKCRRKPPAPEIRNGRYGSSNDLYIEVDTKARTIGFFFRQPCSNSGGELAGRSGASPTVGSLPGTKPGTAVSMSGSYSGPAESGFGTATTTWDLHGRFTRVSAFRGTIHFVVDLPPPNSQTLGFHCETTTLEFELT